MLSIAQLTKTYANGVTALDGVDLEIDVGMFGLLGPNGAGKSSLMRTIAGLQRPTRGRLRFDGVDIVTHPQTVRERLGYLPQEFGVYPRLSAEALLDHIAVLKGLSKAARREQIPALLQKTNLYDVRRKAVSTFSGGMRQRFGIAQALLGDPRLLIVDEPTAGLDPEERNRFLNLLSEIGEDRIVILSTHIVEDVRDLCTRMAILVGGRLALSGEPESLIRTLTNKVWAKVVTKEDSLHHLHVLSTRLVAGRRHLRVLADEAPQGFEAVTPNLEDVYFAVLAEASHAA